MGTVSFPRTLAVSESASEVLLNVSGVVHCGFWKCTLQFLGVYIVVSGSVHCSFWECTLQFLEVYIAVSGNVHCSF